jgi:hypothetical protein
MPGIRQKAIKKKRYKSSKEDGPVGVHESCPAATAVIFIARVFQGQTVFDGPSQVILGIVQKISIQGFQLQPVQASRELIFDKLRVIAVLQTLVVRHQFLKWPSFTLALLAQGQVFSLEEQVDDFK